MLKDNSISTSQATNNGIIHASKIIPSICSKTYRDEEGKIKSVVYPQVLDSVFNSEFFEISSKLKVNMYVFMAFNTLLLFISTLFNNTRFMFFMLYFCIFVSYKLVICIKSSFYMNVFCSSIGKYHSAEHMVNNAYRALGRIPSMEEIKHFSRFSIYCSSMNNINYVVLSLSASLLILFFNGLKLLIASLLLVLFSIIAVKFCLFRFLQIFYTVKPTDAELEVAIESLKNYEQMENEIKSGTIKEFKLTIKLDD